MVIQSLPNTPFQLSGLVLDILKISLILKSHIQQSNFSLIEKFHYVVPASFIDDE